MTAFAIQRRSDDAEAQFAERLLEKLKYACGKLPDTACDHDWFVATALAARDQVVDRWTHTNAVTTSKHVYYLSVEFLIGRLLFDALINLDLVPSARAALARYGIDLDHVRRLEPDAALGNGGLGRLAACYMDSMSSLAVPAIGYGIRYEQGLFQQHIRDGRQEETPDDWLKFGNPWEFIRPEIEYSVRFGGFVEYVGGSTTAHAVWYPEERVLAGAYDIPVVGWRGRHVNTLRLWSARATTPLHLDIFNRGDHVGATALRARAEAISRVLYPSDASPAGQELRLRQEYFFTSASLQDIVLRQLQAGRSLETLPEQAAIQMNDTHPAIAVAELMRLLVDEHDFEWERAWDITRATLNYTNHTLLPEALESWPVELFGRLLPRHLQIIYLINWHHLNAARGAVRDDPAALEPLSLIQEGERKSVRMGHLAFVGSRRINGVSALHSRLLGETVFRDLSAVYPGRIVNKTNGITFRRWLYQANPGLTSLISDTIGDRHMTEPDRLRDLERHAGHAGFATRYASVRQANKVKLARLIRQLTGVAVDPGALFDVQIKRIHEYKRQLLNLVETIALYRELLDNPDGAIAPRVKIFAGKAAPSYTRAKAIIKLAGDIAHVVNSDPRIGDRLKVVFLPNYNVSMAEQLVCSADVSEQISTAGMEASGTGNMKLALNGAITIGTLDGANIEILEHVGPEQVEIFGLTAEQVAAKRAAQEIGQTFVDGSPRLAAALEDLASGRFSADQTDRHRELCDAIVGYDSFMVAADFDAYWDAQRQLDRRWADREGWWRASILNTARMGWFSSDRAIREYAEDIWGVSSIHP